MRTRIGARALLDLTLDADSFLSWDAPLDGVAVLPGSDYDRVLHAARQSTGLDESLVSGEGRIRGRRVAVVACEFAFMAGSFGGDAAERLVLAVERATREGLPLLASPTSGGTRMQEGTIAFLQMVKISAAIAIHKQAGLPYLVYLRDPTTGGVLASWGSLGHVTVAEPGALIGFLGPRVYEALHGGAFPSGVQVAENLFAHGLVDAVLPPQRLADVVDRALNVLVGPRPAVMAAQERDARERDAQERDAPQPVADIPAWESITRSRRQDRPGIRRLLRYAARDVLPLNGTGQGEHDPGLLLALARFGDARCVVLGQDRRGQTAAVPLGPAALREARRGMRLASELRLPLVTVIDTPGAALSKEAEEGGLAGEIARCLAELVMLDAPTLSVLLGQGSGGGALALVPADVVVAAQHGWLSPLPPEGASVIVHRDTEHAAAMAEEQGVRSADLLAAGIVDRVVPERPDAADEPEAFCERVGRAVRDELGRLVAQSAGDRFERRLQRYRRLGRIGDS